MAMCNDSSKFDSTKNDYYTTKQMWENISHLIPKDKIIYEACLLNSKSKSVEYWTEMGYKCIGNKTWDCLTYKPIDYDIIITNPPFENKIKKQILTHFVSLDKPFILVMNVMNTYSKYFREIFGENLKHLQMITPQGKIKFELFNEDTKQIEKCKRDPSFYCVYVCYKMNIPNEDLWLK
tara:strand:+ start:96 stop:632 length:537 start_codon:yes stop_codon:yes gene_type:complete